MDSLSPAAAQLKTKPASSGRARVTNGKCIHLTGDPRGAAARRYRDLLVGYRAALGREPDAVTDSRLRAAAAVALRGELLAAELAAGRRVDPADIFAASSELRRALREAGLEGTTGAAEQGPTLADLIQGKA